MKSGGKVRLEYLWCEVVDSLGDGGYLAVLGDNRSPEPWLKEGTLYLSGWDGYQLDEETGQPLLLPVRQMSGRRKGRRCEDDEAVDEGEDEEGQEE